MTASDVGACIVNRKLGEIDSNQTRKCKPGNKLGFFLQSFSNTSFYSTFFFSKPQALKMQIDYTMV